MAGILNELVQDLQKIKDNPCNDHENGVNWSLLKKFFKKVITNITNVIHLKAWAVVTSDTCGSADPTVTITNFEPWYDPTDFPDIPTPTQARNRKQYQVPDGVLVELDYNWEDEVWEWTGVVHTTVGVGVELGYGSGSLTMTKEAICVPPTCPAAPSSINLVQVTVTKNVLQEASGVGCALKYTPTTIWTFEAASDGVVQIVKEYESTVALRDVYLKADGVYGVFNQFWVPCGEEIGEEKLIDLYYCTASAGAS